MILLHKLYKLHKLCECEDFYNRHRPGTSSESSDATAPEA